jgi:hypothetical protein
MILGYPLLRAYVAEHIQLLFIFSAHTVFLAASPVEARAFLNLVVQGMFFGDSIPSKLCQDIQNCHDFPAEKRRCGSRTAGPP